MCLFFVIFLLFVVVLLFVCGSVLKKVEFMLLLLIVVSVVKQGEVNFVLVLVSIVSGCIVLMVEFGGIYIIGLVGGLQLMQQVGFYIYECGDCSVVDVSSVGNYFNFGGVVYGCVGIGKYYLGDMDNLCVDVQGCVNVDIYFKGVIFGGGVVIDIVGCVLVVYVNVDDYCSQFVGNVGVCIVCGVIWVVC